VPFLSRSLFGGKIDLIRPGKLALIGFVCSDYPRFWPKNAANWLCLARVMTRVALFCSRHGALLSGP